MAILINNELLPLHAEIISFFLWVIMVFGLKKYLDHRYGIKRKTRYKRAICELFIGVSLIFFWLGLKEDWLTTGIPGIIAFFHALGKLAHFAPKKIPDEVEKNGAAFK